MSRVLVDQLSQARKLLLYFWMIFSDDLMWTQVLDSLELREQDCEPRTAQPLTLRHTQHTMQAPERSRSLTGRAGSHDSKAHTCIFNFMSLLLQ